MGLDPPLKELLYLRNCSIPSDICGDILKYLSQCKQLTRLDLGGHRLKECRENYLTEIMKNLWYLLHCWNVYILPNCSIPEIDCTEMLKYLPSCKHLIHLNLNGNKVGKAGIHIAKTIENMGLDPPLRIVVLKKLLNTK